MLLTMVAPVAERLLALTSGAAATKTRRHVHLCAPSRRGRARKKAETLLASAKLSEKDDAPARSSTPAGLPGAADGSLPAPQPNPAPAYVPPAVGEETELEEEDAPPAAASTGRGAAGQMSDQWTARNWLASLDVASDLAAALLSDASPGSELDALRKLAGEATTEEARCQHAHSANTV